MGARAAGLLIVLAALTGCASAPVQQVEIGTGYIHHSSIPEYHDANTTDAVHLPYVEVTIGRKCGDYCPKMGGAVDVELTDKPVFGHPPKRDVIGTLWINQPIKKWRFD